MSRTNRLAGLFFAMAGVLVVTFVISYVMGVVVIRSREEVTRQLEGIRELQELLSTIKDAETGQRGFLLTGDARYLEPYNVAIAHIREEMRLLRNLAERNAIAPAAVARLDDLIPRKLAELAQTIEMRQRNDMPAAIMVVSSDAGRQLMDSIRDVFRQSISQAEGNLRSAQALSDRMTLYRTGVFATSVLANVLFIGWACTRLIREMKQRIEANAEVERQRDLLAVTLSSIGDAVIVTDFQSHITFMNPIAQQLTGWKDYEARGLPCASVFNIVNEQSRSPVESPVDKVLREGVIVGLANHTILIRKDKSEIPIDDSGAPIRDAEGKVRGVVLVFRDFTEHKESERRLRDANASLEAASKAKDQFLATLSHELRTPLTPVLATLSMWEASDETPPALKPDIQMLRRNVELEARLIDDLLDLTRIVKGKMAINLEVVDVHELVRETAEMYASEIRTKRIDLDLALEASCHQVTADPARLQQVFWNLLKNATKFTPTGGAIKVATTNDLDGHIKVEFLDNGIGMSSETLSKLFQPFEQGSSEISRNYGGLGLGLALSKAILEAQGGRISAASPGPKLGSLFTVNMPALAGVSAMPKRPANEPLTRHAHEPSVKLKILVVEDHADTADALVHLLRSMGHEAESVGTVAEAHEKVRSGEFSLLVSDLGLPDGTGIDLMRQARQYFTSPAIALTGFGMEEDINKCKEAGFTAHLTKPVNFQKLVTIIRQVTK